MCILDLHHKLRNMEVFNFCEKKLKKKIYMLIVFFVPLYVYKYRLGLCKFSCDCLQQPLAATNQMLHCMV